MPYVNITSNVESYTFSVKVSDSESLVNSDTITNNSIRVTGPNSFSKLATIVSKTPATGNASLITVNCSVVGPFSASTNGFFQIRTTPKPNPGAIADVIGNAVVDNIIGSFECVIPIDVAPTLQTALVNPVNRFQIILTYSETLATSTPAVSAFALTGKTISGVAIASNKVTLTLSTEFTAGTSATLTYTPPGTNKISDTAGNAASGFSQLVSESGAATLSLLPAGSKVLLFMGGQSNMNGHPDTQIYAGGPPPSTTKWWNELSSAYVDMVPGGSGGFRAWENPVVYTAKALEAAYPSLRFFIAEHSVGGDGFQSGGGGFAVGNSSRLALIARIQNGIAAMQAQGPFYYAGFIWNQGEAECFTAANATNFPAQFKSLKDEIKALSSSSIKTLVTRINAGYKSVNNSTPAQLNAVRTALTVTSGANAMGDQWVNVDDLTLTTDPDNGRRHYSGPNYKIIGDRYALALNGFDMISSTATGSAPTGSVGAVVSQPVIGASSFEFPATFTANSGTINGSTLPNLSVTLGNGAIATATPKTPLPFTSSSITHNYVCTIGGGVTAAMNGTLPVRLSSVLSNSAGGSLAANTQIGSIVLSAAAAGSTETVDFTTASALPAGWTSTNTNYNFSSANGITVTSTFGGSTDWGQAAIIGPTWDQTKKLSFSFKGFDAQGGVGVAQSPIGWLQAPVAESFVGVKFSAYGASTKIFDYPSGAYVIDRPYRIDMYRIGADVKFELYQNSGSGFSLAAEHLRVGAAAALVGSKVFIDPRIGNQRVTRIEQSPIAQSPALSAVVGAIASQPNAGATTFEFPITYASATGTVPGSGLPNLSITLGNGATATSAPKAPLPSTAATITHTYVCTVSGGVTAAMNGTLPVRTSATITDSAGAAIASNTQIGNVDLSVVNASDTIKPALTLMGAPLASGNAGTSRTFTVRITDAGGLNLANIVATAFSIKNPNGVEVAKTISTSGSATQQDVVFTLTPTLTGTNTIEVLADAIADTAGNFANAATLGSFTVTDAPYGSPINDDFLTLSSLPAHYTTRGTSDVTLSFSGTTGLTLTRVGTTSRPGRSAMVSVNPWDQARPLQITFKGYTFRGEVGLSVDPLDWIARNATNPKDSLVSFRNREIYYATDSLTGYGANYNTGRDYRATFTKSGADVLCTIEENVSGTWTQVISTTAVGASGPMRNARIFVDSREGNMQVKKITN